MYAIAPKDSFASAFTHCKIYKIELLWFHVQTRIKFKLMVTVKMYARNLLCLNPKKIDAEQEK